MNLRYGDIIRFIKPVYVKIFYEKDIPYLYYIGKTTLDDGMEVSVEIPKMGLELSSVKTLKTLIKGIPGKRLSTFCNQCYANNKGDIILIKPTVSQT